MSAYSNPVNWKSFSDTKSLSMIVINPTSDGFYDRGKGDLLQMMTSVFLKLIFTRPLATFEILVTFRETSEQLTINNNGDFQKTSWPAVVTSVKGDGNREVPNLLASL
jgi:hypothetical protein